MATESPHWVYGTKSSFAAGELTPTIEGRGDLPLYQNGAKKILNWMILPSGGLTRRPGTAFIWAKRRRTSSGEVSVLGPGPLEGDDPVGAATPMLTAQDLTSRLCRIRNKLAEKGGFFNYGILDKEDAAYAHKDIKK